MSRRRLPLAWIALLPLAFVLAAETEKPALVASSPADLVPAVGERLGPPFSLEEVTARVAPEGERRNAVTAYTGDAFAPLRTPACLRLLARLGIPAPDPDRLAILVAGSAPAASIGTDDLLVPDSLPPQGRAAVELLQTSGLLPFEVALTGEWARLVAARHIGPPLADPLLRQARAARLEGTARLAAISMVLEGGGIEPSAIGAALLRADRDRAGLPRREAYAGARSAVERAALRVLLEDGLRWAAYHFLQGGPPALLAGLERPLVGPAELLRPGQWAQAADRPAGACVLGPRSSAALLTGEDDPEWLDALIRGVFTAGQEGVTVRLDTESDSSAERVASTLEAAGRPASAAGRTVMLLQPLESAGAP